MCLRYALIKNKNENGNVWNEMTRTVTKETSKSKFQIFSCRLYTYGILDLEIK